MIRYLDWNKALLNYYFGKNGDCEVTSLYIDRDILRKVGEQAGLDPGDQEYLDSFLSCTIRDCVSCRKTPKRRAEDFVNTTNGELFFFAMMMAVILSAQEMQGDTVITHELINQYWNGENPYGYTANCSSNDNASRVFHEMAVKLAELKPSFKDPMLADRDYRVNMGRIKYHIVLSARERNRIMDILAQQHFYQWDEDVYPYCKEIVDRFILPKLRRETMDDPIRIKIKKPDNIDFMKNLLREYNYENYIKSHEAHQNSKTSIDLMFILKYVNSTNGFQLLLGTTAKINDKYGFLCFSGDDNKKNYGLYPVSWGPDGTHRNINWNSRHDYKFEDNNLCIDVLGGDIAVFEKHDYSYVQIPDNTQEPNKSYLFVCSGNGQPNDGYNTYEEYTKLFSEYFPNCRVFYVRNWNAIPQNNRQKRATTNNDNSEYVELSDGIKSPKYSRHFISTALPYFHIHNYSADDGEYTVLMNNADQQVELQNTVDITSGGNVFVGIDGSITETSMRVYFQLFRNGEKFDSQKNALVSQESSIRLEESCPYRYDGWGMTIEQEDGKEYYEEGVLHGREPDLEKNNQSVILSVTQETPSEASFLLVELLTAVSNECAEFSDRQFSQIIQYVALRNDCPDLSYSEISEIKSMLMELGYINRRLDEGLKPQYQVSRLLLVPTSKRLTDNGKNVYLLYGGYTQAQRKKIYSLCSDEISYYKPYDPESLRKRPYLRIIPWQILVPQEDTDAVISIINEDNEKVGIEWRLESIPVMDNYGIVEFAKGMDEFEEDILKHSTKNQYTDVAERHASPDNTYPRCVWNDVDNRFQLELRDGYYVSYQINGEGFHHKIPTDMMKLYCQMKRDLPVVVAERGCGGTLPKTFDTLYFTKDMGIPYLIKRALNMLNLAVRKEEYAFGVDWCLSDDVFYTQLYRYDVSGINEEFMKLLVHKLSGDRVEDLSKSSRVKWVEGQSDYTIKVRKDTEGPYPRYELWMFRNNGLIAYSKSKKSVCVRIDGSFREITGDTPSHVNDIISAIIMRRPRIFEENLYNTPVNGDPDIPTDGLHELKVFCLAGTKTDSTAGDMLISASGVNILSPIQRHFPKLYNVGMEGVEHEKIFKLLSDAIDNHNANLESLKADYISNRKELLGNIHKVNIDGEDSIEAVLKRKGNEIKRIKSDIEAASDEMMRRANKDYKNKIIDVNEWMLRINNSNVDDYIAIKKKQLTERENEVANLTQQLNNCRRAEQYDKDIEIIDRLISVNNQ